MGNLLSFPTNVRDLAKNNPATSSQALLSSLSFLRDCLERGSTKLDAASWRTCIDAADHAINEAMKTDRTILGQSLRIDEMQRLAATDELTGAHNRRGFEEELRRVLAAAGRFDETGVLVYIDLDGFKPINDTYGHAAGDRVLCEVVRTLQDGIRPQDFVARLGGDEFAVILTRTGWRDGLGRADALKHALNTLHVRWKGKSIAVRASLGYQRFGPNDQERHLLSKADEAMYKAKRVRAAALGTTPR